MKKFLAVLLCLSLMTSLFVGCTKDPDTSNDSTNDATSNDTTKEPNDSSEASGEVVEIKWMFWDDLSVSEDLISIGYAEVLDRFNKAYEGQYHVTAITTNLEEYDTKLNALVAGGQAPDVFTVNPGPNLTQYVEAGVAADLTPIFKGDEAEWFGTFTEGIFERMTYDDKIYAVPTNFAAALVFYNTEMFENAGAKVPENFDEWIEACEKLEAAGYTPISVSAGTAWCLSMIAGYLCDRQGGPDNLIGANAGTVDWTSESFVDAGYNLVELSKYFQETAAGDSYDQANAAFYNEEAAMLVQGSWVIGQMNGANPDFEEKCGVFNFPGIVGGADPNRMIVKTDNLAMSSTTKNQEAAIALMKFFTDETAQKYTAEVGGKIPVINVEYDEDKAPSQLGYVMEILNKSTGTLGFYNESLASVEAGNVFDNSMVDLFFGAFTPEEAFQNIQTFYEDNVWNK